MMLKCLCKLAINALITRLKDRTMLEGSKKWLVKCKVELKRLAVRTINRTEFLTSSRHAMQIAISRTSQTKSKRRRL